MIDLNADVVYDKILEIANDYAQNPPTGVPPFASVHSLPMVVTPPDTDLPRLGVYIRESATAYTYGIAATPQFWNTITITLTGAMKYSDEDKQFATLRTLMSSLNTRLLCDPNFNAMGVAFNGWNRRFDTSHLAAWSVAELRIDHMFGFRTVFPPAVVDDFNFTKLHITRKVHGSAGDTVVQEVTYDQDGNTIGKD